MQKSSATLETCKKEKGEQNEWFAYRLNIFAFLLSSSTSMTDIVLCNKLLLRMELVELSVYIFTAIDGSKIKTCDGIPSRFPFRGRLRFQYIRRGFIKILAAPDTKLF